MPGDGQTKGTAGAARRTRRAVASAKDRSRRAIWSEASARRPFAAGEIGRRRWFRRAAAVPGHSPKSRLSRGEAKQDGLPNITGPTKWRRAASTDTAQ